MSPRSPIRRWLQARTGWLLVIVPTALAALANRAMRLQCLIQDGEMLITGEGESIRIEPEVVFGK